MQNNGIWIIPVQTNWQKFHLLAGFLVIRILSLSSGGCAICMPYGKGSAMPMA